MEFVFDSEAPAQANPPRGKMEFVYDRPSDESQERMTADERQASRLRAIERARQPDDEETSLGRGIVNLGKEWLAPITRLMPRGGQEQSTTGHPLTDAAAEGLRGGRRAALAAVKPFVGLATGAVRLAGTPVRMATGWDGLHRLANAIDNTYDDWGSRIAGSDYGDSPDGALNAAGRFGEKVSGIAGTLGSFMTPGAVAKLGNAPRAVQVAGAVAQKALPFIAADDAAVNTYDNAMSAAMERNGGKEPDAKERTRALALASVNGVIHYIGWKAFQNQSLNKMIDMPQSMEAMTPQFFKTAQNTGAKTFSELSRGVRNGIYKYIVMERARGALKAGGIMGLQNFLSAFPEQFAADPNADWGEVAKIALKGGVHGVAEGALMEGLMGGASAMFAPRDAYAATSRMVRKGWDVTRPDGTKMHVPGLLETPEGRQFVFKQSPELQTRIMDIVRHGGEVTPEELDAACLPSDMTKAELKKLVDNWGADLAVEETRGEEGGFLGDGGEMESRSPVEENPDRASIPFQVEMARRTEGQPPQLGYNGAINMPPNPGATWRNEPNPGFAFGELVRRGTGAPEKTVDATTKKEIRTNETGTVADEASARSEQGQVVAPPAGAEARPVEGAEAPAEAADAGVVDRPQRLRRRLTSNMRHPAENKAEATQKPAEVAPTVPEAQSPAEPAKPVEAPSRASDAVFENEQLEMAYRMIKGGVEKDIKAGESLALEAIEKMKGRDLDRLLAMQGKKGFPDDESTRAIMEIAESERGNRWISDEPLDPDGPTPDPVAKPTKVAPRASDTTFENDVPPAEPDEGPLPSFLAPDEAPAEPPAPKPVPKSNRLRRADGTNPLAEGKPMSKTLRKAVDKISSAIANRTGDGVITPDEAYGIVRGIAESPGTKHNRTRDFFAPLEKDASWHESLGLDAESAKNIRDAFNKVKTDADLKKWFTQVNAAVKKAKSGELTEKEAVPLFGKISEGLEKAERMGLPEAAKRLREAAEVIRPVAEAVTQGDVAKFNYSTKGRKLNSGLGGTDKRGKKTVSLDTRNGTVDVGADGKTLDDVVDEIADSSRDARSLRPGESYGKGFTGEERDAGGEPVEGSGEAGGGTNAKGIESNDTGVPFAGFTATIGENGKIKLIKTYDTKEYGRYVERQESAEISQEQFRAMAKQFGVDADAMLEKMTNGKELEARASRSTATGLPTAWTPETQKPLERVAHALRNVVTVGGKKVEVEFLDKRPETDDPGAFKNSDGVTVGNYAKGKIRLYPGAKVADVVHEFTHPLMDFARAEAKAGRGEFLNKIREIIDAERATWEQPVRDAYKGKGEGEILEEIFTHAMGEKGAKLFGKSTNTLQGRRWYNQLWQAIKELWQDFATKMGWNKADLRGLERMSPEDAARKILSEMAKGRSFGDATASSVRESRSVRPGNPAKPTTDLIDEKRTKGERLQEGVQDKDVAIRNIQEELGGITDKQTASGHTDAKTTFKPDGTVDKLGSTDVHSAKMRANGHLQAGFNEIEAKQRRIDKTLADNGITPEEFGNFLYAEHAPERNQTIAERKAEDANKAAWRKARAEAAKGNTAPLDALRKAVVVDPANKEYSGMSTDEAKAYLASPAVAAKRAALDSAAQELYRMQRQNLDRLLESGRISKEFHDLLTTRWKKYVPLRTDVEGKDGAAYNLSVGGFRQNEFMTAEGRKTLADSPYAFAMLQVQQGLCGAEANTINLTAANLVRYAESLGHHIGDIMQGKEAGRGKGWTFNFGDGDIVQVGGDMKLAKNRNDIMLFKEDGELKAVRFVKGANGRGEALADAITGRNVKQWHKDLAFLPRVTSWLSAMRTQYSPEFSFSNALADHMESALALVGRYGIKDGFKLAGKALAWEKRNLKDLRRYIKTGDPGTGYVKEAVDAGILIKGGVAAQGYSGELRNIESSYEKFVRNAKGFGGMTAKEKASFVWDGLKDFVSNTNELIENSTRIGIYSALREMKVPKADAVKFAREATVDFNRKGTYTPWLNGLYMFSNASVQGAMRSVQAMGDEHGGQLIGLLVAAGVAKAALDHYLGNDDEREKAGGRNARNLSEYDRKHKLGIPVPGTSKQITAIRMRGPYAAIPYLAQTFANVALGETSAADAAKVVARELADQATDLVGGNGMLKDNGEFDGALLGQSFAPTLADPFVQLATGKDYKGDELRRKTFDKTMPLSSNGKRSTFGPYKDMAKGLNWLTGGNENRKGLADFAPEDLQLVVEFLLGGVGRDLHNVYSTAKNAKEFASGGTPERTLSQTPFLRTLVNEYPEPTSRYYSALEDYERDKAEFKKTTPERRREMRKGKPYLFAGKSLLDGQIERIKELTHLERGEIKVGQKWVEPRTPRTEAQKERFRKLRLEMQARVLKRLGE